MDAHLCAIEIFGDVNQCIRNAEKLNELIFKGLQRCCKYSVCCAWIIPDIWKCVDMVHGHVTKYLEKVDVHVLK